MNFKILLKFMKKTSIKCDHSMWRKLNIASDEKILSQKYYFLKTVTPQSLHLTPLDFYFRDFQKTMCKKKPACIRTLETK